MKFNDKVFPAFKSLFDKILFNVINPYKYLFFIFIGREIQNPVPFISLLLLRLISHIELIICFIFGIYFGFSE